MSNGGALPPEHYERVQAAWTQRNEGVSSRACKLAEDEAAKAAAKAAAEATKEATEAAKAAAKAYEQRKAAYTGIAAVNRKTGGELSLASNTAKVTLPPGAVTSNIEICLRDATATSRPSDAAYVSALRHLGAEPCGPLLELLPHGATFGKQVTIEMAVAPGDETKEMRLLHRDVDSNKRCQWEVLRAIPRPLGPGRVAVEVSAFCMVMLSFPFSGMNKLIRMEWSTEKGNETPWLGLKKGLAIMATCCNPACEAVKMADEKAASKGKKSPGKTRVMVNLGFTRFDVCDDDTWKYKIKCPKCQTSCGRSARDTVYLCDTVWKFEGQRADGARREDEGYCDNHPYCMEACESDNIQAEGAR